MKKKYLFFDYDGTLTDLRTMSIVPSAIEAIDLLQANGHFCALATGRSYYKSKQIMEKIHVENGVCSCGGGIILNKKLIKDEPLDLENVKQLIRECKMNNIGYQLSLEDGPVLISDSALFSKQCKNHNEGDIVIDPNFDFEKVDKVLKAYVSVSEEDEYKLPALNKLGKLRFMPGFLIIQHDKKKQAIIELMNYLKAPIEDVVVFGDGSNDINMFDARWTNIAMGNAVEELKKLATYVSDNSYDDGIYNACKHFNWI